MGDFCSMVKRKGALHWTICLKLTEVVFWQIFEQEQYQCMAKNSTFRLWVSVDKATFSDKSNKIRDLFKVKLYTIRSETK